MKDKDPYAIEVGKAIRHFRDEKGWTQVYLAEKADISSNYLARLERSEMGASLYVADKICQALSIRLDQLVASCPEIK